MMSQEKRLFCRLDGLTTEAREQQRLQALTELGLLQAESIPVFEEATQMAAQTLGMPIAYLSLMEPDREWLKTAIGLSRLGLMNELASTRQISRLDSFSTHVVDSQQLLVIDDTLNHPAFAHSYLVNHFDIRAYMGAPLTTAAGLCVGAIAVMDTAPHTFSAQDSEFLLLMARWSMSEYERATLAQQAAQTAPQPGPVAIAVSDPDAPNPSPTEPAIVNQIRVDLLTHLTQELRTPLTSVLGMTSVLNREIYGPLTSKQKEYVNIIHTSGQYLLSLMNEIVELSEFRDTNQSLNLSSVDIEMLCQQAINTLEHAADRRGQKIRLTVEPSRRIWLIDKDKVRQMLYHLMFCVIQSSTAGSIVRLHVSRRENELTLSIWVSHPWLGEGLPYVEVYSEPSLVTAGIPPIYDEIEEVTAPASPNELLDEAAEQKAVLELGYQRDTNRKNLGLLLCQQLAELHEGTISVQGSSEGGFRYVISLPWFAEPSEN